MPIYIKRSTVVETTEELQIDLASNPGLIMQILQGMSKYDHDQEQHRALGRTAQLTILDDDTKSDEDLISDQEEEAKQEDIKSDNWEYRKRKNKFILGEAPEDNRGRKKKLRRGRQIRKIIEDEEDELTFEEEVIIIE